MPYSSIDELPDQVKDLPTKAKQIFLATFNSAFSDSCKDKGDKRESCSFAIAYGAVKQKYEQVDGKWKEKKTKTQSIIRSITTDKPKIDNGTWIPYLKEGQLAEDSAGKKYRLTKSAIEKGYESFRGGYVNINHKDSISGKIEDVKYDGNFAYAKLSGLDEEALDVINSVAYRGVSQESVNVTAVPNSDGLIDVMQLQGKGLAIALYPKTPGCPLSSGCGLPLESTINDESNFSLYSSQNNGEVIKGDTTAGYTTEELKDMLKFMKGHPDMMDDGMVSMMKGMVGMMTKSTIEGNMTEENKPETKPESDALLKSTLADFEVLKKENETLKSTITTLKEEAAKLKADIPVIIESTLKAHASQIKTEQEYAKAQEELFSIDKDAATELMAIKPDIGVLKSTITLWKKTTKTSPAGVGTGMEINSTVDFDYDKERTAFYSSIGRT